MLNFVWGIVAFLLFFIYDLEQAGYITRRFHKIIQSFFLLGILLLALSTGSAIWERIGVFDWTLLSVIGLLCTLICLGLLVYTLFFALPFQETYVTQVVISKKIYTEGMYALCRHPGVIWFSGMYFFLWVTLGGNVLFLMLCLYTFLNYLYVLLQDKYIFPRIFFDYDQYKGFTPFLIPNKNSVKRCIATFRKESW